MAIDRRWCLLLDNKRELLAFIEGGEIRSAEMGSPARKLLHDVSEHVCFTNQPKAILALGDARYFQGKQRRERLLEIRLDDGPKLSIVPSIPDLDCHSYALAFATYCAWLREIGIQFDKRSGWNTLGKKIWRLTDGATKFSGPTQARLAFYGGRKQAPFPATFQQAQHFDISAAYLYGLGMDEIPSRLVPCPAGEWRTNPHGIAYAKVTVPESIGEWLPLPTRADKRIVRLLRFKAGNIEGAWTFSELRMAAEYGCDVKPLQAWGGQHSKAYFSGWYRTMLSGRGLPHSASHFAKQHANLLWSSFATSASRITWKRWNDSYGHDPIIIKEQLPGQDFSVRTSFVSAIVSSRIRERLYREVLCPNGKPNLFVIHCDTDGIVTGTRHNLPNSLRNPKVGPGEWRRTKGMSLVEIRSPNAYRYLCTEGCGETHTPWHYNCAGASNPDAARRLFGAEPRTRDALDLDSLDPECLPEVLAEYKPKIRRPKYSDSSPSSP